MPDEKVMRKWRPQWLQDYYKLPANQSRFPSFHLWRWAFDCIEGKPILPQQKFRAIQGNSQQTTKPDAYAYIDKSVQYQPQHIPLTWEQLQWIVENGKDMKTPIKKLVGKLILDGKIDKSSLTPRQISWLARAPEAYVYTEGRLTKGEELVDDLGADMSDEERDKFFMEIEGAKPKTAPAPKPVPASTPVAAAKG